MEKRPRDAGRVTNGSLSSHAIGNGPLPPTHPIGALLTGREEFLRLPVEFWSVGAGRKPGMIGQVLVDSPLNHGRYLHDKGEGHVTLAQKVQELAPDDDWQQHSYPLGELHEVLPAYGGLDDAYISQNRFWGPRSVARLAGLSAMYADLDYYRVPALEGMHPLGVMDLAFEDLQLARIPRPSLVVSTGRGLALVWRHDTVPRYVLPKWKLCQDHIFEALRGLGADPVARDAARVLRLVGTRNSKSGTIVRTIWEETGEGSWDFSDLADEILPFSREQLEELRAEQCPHWESGEERSSKDGRKAPTADTITIDPLTRVSDIIGA